MRERESMHCLQSKRQQLVTHKFIERRACIHQWAWQALLIAAPLACRIIEIDKRKTSTIETKEEHVSRKSEKGRITSDICSNYVGEEQGGTIKESSKQKEP